MAAQNASKRDKLFEVIKHQRRGITPMSLGIDAYVMTLKEYKDRLAGQSAEEYFGLWHRTISPDLSKGKQDHDYGKYHKNLPPDAAPDEFGVAHVHNERESVEWSYPMRDFNDPAQIDDYPFPDFTRPACYEGLREKAAAFKNSGFLVKGGTWRVVFPLCWHLRGMEEFFVDLLTRPRFAEKLLDKVTYCQLEIIRGVVSAGVDLLTIGMDAATQQSTMISPRTWADFIKPRMKVLFDEARKINPDVLIYIHCCGNVTPILEHLIDLGVNVVNPVQPEAMDLELVKRKYGDALTFWGGVSLQKTLPFGTPEEVRAEVRERVKTLGRNGGYIVCPAHDLTRDVPWKNITAFVEEAGKYS